MVPKTKESSDHHAWMIGRSALQTGAISNQNFLGAQIGYSAFVEAVIELKGDQRRLRACTEVSVDPGWVSRGYQIPLQMANIPSPRMF